MSQKDFVRITEYSFNEIDWVHNLVPTLMKLINEKA